MADAESDKLLGAHIVGSNAGDIVGELTWAEGIKLAGQPFTKDVAKLSCCA